MVLGRSGFEPLTSRCAALALNLVPFVGVTFLRFIGVLRDRLGQQKDRFFAAVFFGRALLFLAIFAATEVGRTLGKALIYRKGAQPAKAHRFRRGSR